MQNLNRKLKCIITALLLAVNLLWFGCNMQEERLGATTSSQTPAAYTQAMESMDAELFTFDASATPSPVKNTPDQNITRLQADLDGDGEEEQCEIKGGYFERIIRINDKEIEIEDYAPSEITCVIVDIDERDDYKEIAYYSKDYQEYPDININEHENTTAFTHFIRWDGENIINLGYARGVPDETRIERVEIPGDGIVTGVEASWIMTEVFYRYPQQVDPETKTLKLIQQESYEYVVPRECTVIQPFQAYKKTDVNAKKIELVEGEQLTLYETDRHSWVHFTTDKGKKGWILIAPNYFPRLKGETIDYQAHFQEIDKEQALQIAPFETDRMEDEYDLESDSEEQKLYAPVYNKVVIPLTVYTEPDEDSEPYQIEKGEVIMRDSAFFNETFDIRWIHIIDQRGNTAWICTVSDGIHQNRNIAGYGDYMDYLVFTDLDEDYPHDSV